MTSGLYASYRFLEERRYCRFFKNRMESTGTEREIDNVADCRDEYRRTFLRSQVGIGSESDCLLGQSNRIL